MKNSYFQDGFTYMMSIFFGITGIAYGISAKTIKSDKDLFNKLKESLSELGIILVMIFFASQFIAIFKESNIGTVIAATMANMLQSLPFSGAALIIVAIILIAISNIFVTGSIAKWVIFSSTMVPTFMQLGIAPQFTQFIFRAAESMTNGITPLLAYFVVYLGYMNIYNKDYETFHEMYKDKTMSTELGLGRNGLSVHCIQQNFMYKFHFSGKDYTQR